MVKSKCDDNAEGKACNKEIWEKRKKKKENKNTTQSINLKLDSSILLFKNKQIKKKKNWKKIESKKKKQKGISQPENNP